MKIFSMFEWGSGNSGWNESIQIKRRKKKEYGENDVNQYPIWSLASRALILIFSYPINSNPNTEHMQFKNYNLLKINKTKKKKNSSFSQILNTEKSHWVFIFFSVSVEFLKKGHHVLSLSTCDLDNSWHLYKVSLHGGHWHMI